jgi:hypothetical protein
MFFDPLGEKIAWRVDQQAPIIDIAKLQRQEPGIECLVADLTPDLSQEGPPGGGCPGC